MLSLPLVLPLAATHAFFLLWLYTPEYLTLTFPPASAVRPIAADLACTPCWHCYAALQIGLQPCVSHTSTWWLSRTVASLMAIACRLTQALKRLDLQPPSQHKGEGSDPGVSASDKRSSHTCGPNPAAVMMLLLVADPQKVWVPRQYPAWEAAYKDLLEMLGTAFDKVSNHCTTLLYCTVPYSILLCHTVLYCTVLWRIVLYCTVCTVL